MNSVRKCRSADVVSLLGEQSRVEAVEILCTPGELRTQRRRQVVVRFREVWLTLFQMRCRLGVYPLSSYFSLPLGPR